MRRTDAIVLREGTEDSHDGGSRGPASSCRDLENRKNRTCRAEKQDSAGAALSYGYSKVRETLNRASCNGEAVNMKHTRSRLWSSLYKEVPKGAVNGQSTDAEQQVSKRATDRNERMNRGEKKEEQDAGNDESGRARIMSEEKESADSRKDSRLETGVQDCGGGGPLGQIPRAWEPKSPVLWFHHTHRQHILELSASHFDGFRCFRFYNSDLVFAYSVTSSIENDFKRELQLPQALALKLGELASFDYLIIQSQICS